MGKTTINYDVICTTSGNKGMQFYTRGTSPESYIFKQLIGTWGERLTKILDAEYTGKNWLFISNHLRKNLPHYKLTTNECIYIK